MLDQQKVFRMLAENGVTFFVGVPDSYLNGFCNYALNNIGDRFIIAANEGNAVGIAAGHYLASGEIPLVFMQNSGIGNSVNPLVSMTDKDVYSIPMVLLIGWRGQGNTEPNHPQHKLQGQITTTLFDAMRIPYRVLSDSDDDFSDAVREAAEFSAGNRCSFALIAPRGVMAESSKANDTDSLYPMSREEAIETVLNAMPDNTVYSATTGRTTRELFFLRERRGEPRSSDFLNVGSMGHASSVALGIALEKPDRPVVVLDGDSAAIMHMGAMTMVSKLSVPNYLHIILNNGAHESVGGQPSAGYRVDFTSIAEACGYATVGRPVMKKDELTDAIGTLRESGKASFIDCRVHKGLSRKLPPIVFDHREAIDELIHELNK